MLQIGKNEYHYDWTKFDKEKMLDWNHWLKKVNQKACIQYGFINDAYEPLDRHGNIDWGLGFDVEYFHPSITLDDRMRYIGTVIAQADMSLFNIVGNTFISHFYGGRGVHQALTQNQNENDCFIDFDRIAANDIKYIKELQINVEIAKEKKQAIWGSTELHTSIQAASRNYCRSKYSDDQRKFNNIDVCEWVASFKHNGVFDQMMKVDHMKDMFHNLKSQSGIGDYYGFHGSASTSVLPQVKYHNDQRFVAPGPGAVYTIKYMWPEAPRKLYPEAIYFIRENADEIGLTDGVLFHPKTYNIETKNGPLFEHDQNSLKYYGSEVCACQYNIYTKIRHSKELCEKRKVARSDDFNSTGVQDKNDLSGFFCDIG